MDSIQETDDLREVLSHAGWVRGAFDFSMSETIMLAFDPGADDIFLRLHGDEGPFFKNRNLLVLSLSFPHNHGVAYLHMACGHHARFFVFCWCASREFELRGGLLGGWNEDTLFTRLALCHLAPILYEVDLPTVPIQDVAYHVKARCSSGPSPGFPAAAEENGNSDYS